MANNCIEKWKVGARKGKSNETSGGGREEVKEGAQCITKEVTGESIPPSQSRKKRSSRAKVKEKKRKEKSEK